MAHNLLAARISEVPVRRKAFAIPCLIALATALSSSVHAATLNYNLNYNLNGGPSGSSGSGEFGVNEVNKLFNNVGRPFDQQILDFINGNSDSGLTKSNSESGLQNGNSDTGLFGPNGQLGLFSRNPRSTTATTTLDQIFTNGALTELSLAQNPTGQSSSISTGVSNATVNGSLGLSVGSTSAKPFSEPKFIVTSFLNGTLPLLNLQPEAGSDIVNSITASTAPFVSAASVVSSVPLPAALPLFATGLGAMGLLGWWRERKARSVA